MLKKRGDLSFQVIVLAIIALIVMVVVISIFVGQAQKRTSDYDDIASGVLKNRCEKALFSKNVCAEVSPPGYVEVTSPKDGWVDCNTKEKCFQPK